MLILHAHWQPSRSPDDTGGVLFWAETSEAAQPTRQRGRLAKKPRPKDHPFCTPPNSLGQISEFGIQNAEAGSGQATGWC